MARSVPPYADEWTAEMRRDMIDVLKPDEPAA
jgi:hypothetical protein